MQKSKNKFIIFPRHVVVKHFDGICIAFKWRWFCTVEQVKLNYSDFKSTTYYNIDMPESL